MSKANIPRVTIAIPTYNRSSLLEVSLKSALSQSYEDLEILVLDNASSDDTPAIVEKFTDSRIKYIRHPENVGPLRNWNRVITLNRSPYLLILQDDDILLPECISECLQALEANPAAAFTFGVTAGIDLDNQPVPIPGECPTQGGVISGLELLHQYVTGTNWVIHVSTVLMRSSALEQAGFFDALHAKMLIDLPLYFRMASLFDVVFVAKTLAHVRLHVGQLTEQCFRVEGSTGPISILGERTDAIAYLLKSSRCEDPAYRSWLADRLLDLSMRRSEMTGLIVPELTLSWDEKAAILKEEVELIVPAGVDFLLMDNDEFAVDFVSGRQALPLMQSDGASVGPPPDENTAIEALEELHQAGVNFVVVAWPAFWWLDYYSGLREHLRSHYTCVLRNSRMIAYELQAK